MNGSSKHQKQQQYATLSVSESTTSTTETSSVSSSVIQIRPYQPKDEKAVQDLFCSSMGTHRSIIFRTILSSLPVALGITVYWMICVGVTSYPFENDEKGAWFMMIITSPWYSAPGWMMMAAATVAVVVVVVVTAPLVALDAFVKYQIIRPYLARQVKSDLSNISTVYAHPGGFWVAQEVSTGTLVGCVGAQHHPDDNQEDDKNKDSHGMDFELRRMCVAKNEWNRGLGQRLIRALEQHVVTVSAAAAAAASSKKKPPTVFLTCAQFQHAAHAFYEKTGFQLKETKGMEDNRIAFRHLMSVRRYEKQL